MDTKTCCRCNTTYAATKEFFYKIPNKEYLMGHCKTCHAVQTRAWQVNNHDKYVKRLSVWRDANHEHKKSKDRKYYNENRADYYERNEVRNEKLWRKTIDIVDAMKLKPCTDCNKTYMPIQMDFDHVSGEKHDNVSSLMHRHKSLRRVLDEISKCELVCSNCHRVRTEVRRLATHTHKQLPTDKRKLAAYLKREEGKEYIKEQKYGKPCHDCGKTYHYAAMDYDHRDPSIKVCDISRLPNARVKINKIAAEIAKCDLVCHNCHRLRTHKISNTGTFNTI
jgi:hypothetical protein